MKTALLLSGLTGCYLWQPALALVVVGSILFAGAVASHFYGAKT
jgi:hypothetical protein